MIRPFTFVTMLLAAGSGLYLYQTKHQAQVLDREIARTMKTADTVRQRAGLMRAEYALLNDPARLAELSGQWLPELRNTAPAQYSSWSDFDRRLPAIGAPPPPAPLEPQAPDAVLPKAAPAKVEPAKFEPVRLEPARVEPPKVDTARQDLPRPPIAVAAQPRPAVATPPAPAPIQQASVIARPATLSSPALAPIQSRPAATPAPVTASLPAPVSLHTPTPPPAGRSTLAVATPLPAAPHATPPATPAEAIARIVRGGPIDPSVPAVASALGMARTMVPSASAISPAQAAVGQR